MYGLGKFWDSTVGKKFVMAVTGIVGVLFVIGHMAGNLQMFYPNAPEAMAHYARLLRISMPLLWAVRVGLIVSVVLHIISAYQLTMRSRAARPEAYQVRKPQVTTLAARTMKVGGVLLLAFLVFHIAHMTLGQGIAGFVHLDPYNNLRLGLANPLVAAFYIVAVAFLGLHLYHGAWAAFRTLGVARPSTQPLKRRLAIVIAIIVALGFMAVPIAAMTGMFPEAPAPQAEAN